MATGYAASVCPLHFITSVLWIKMNWKFENFQFRKIRGLRGQCYPSVPYSSPCSTPSGMDTTIPGYNLQQPQTSALRWSQNWQQYLGNWTLKTSNLGFSMPFSLVLAGLGHSKEVVLLTLSCIRDCGSTMEKVCTQIPFHFFFDFLNRHKIFL